MSSPSTSLRVHTGEKDAGFGGLASPGNQRVSPVSVVSQAEAALRAELLNVRSPPITRTVSSPSAAGFKNQGWGVGNSGGSLLRRRPQSGRNVVLDPIKALPNQGSPPKDASNHFGGIALAAHDGLPTHSAEHSPDAGAKSSAGRKARPVSANFGSPSVLVTKLIGPSANASLSTPPVHPSTGNRPTSSGHRHSLERSSSVEASISLDGSFAMSIQAALDEGGDGFKFPSGRPSPLTLRSPIVSESGEGGHGDEETAMRALYHRMLMENPMTPMDGGVHGGFSSTAHSLAGTSASLSSHHEFAPDIRIDTTGLTPVEDVPDSALSARSHFSSSDSGVGGKSSEVRHSTAPSNDSLTTAKLPVPSPHQTAVPVRSPPNVKRVSSTNVMDDEPQQFQFDLWSRFKRSPGPAGTPSPAPVTSSVSLAPSKPSSAGIEASPVAVSAPSRAATATPNSFTHSTSNPASPPRPEQYLQARRTGSGESTGVNVFEGVIGEAGSGAMMLRRLSSPMSSAHGPPPTNTPPGSGSGYRAGRVLKPSPVNGIATTPREDSHIPSLIPTPTRPTQPRRFGSIKNVFGSDNSEVSLADECAGQASPGRPLPSPRPGSTVSHPPHGIPITKTVSGSMSSPSPSTSPRPACFVNVNSSRGASLTPTHVLVNPSGNPFGRIHAVPLGNESNLTPSAASVGIASPVVLSKVALVLSPDCSSGSAPHFTSPVNANAGVPLSSGVVTTPIAQSTSGSHPDSVGQGSSVDEPIEMVPTQAVAVTDVASAHVPCVVPSPRSRSTSMGNPLPFSPPNHEGNVVMSPSSPQPPRRSLPPRNSSIGNSFRTTSLSPVGPGVAPTYDRVNSVLSALSTLSTVHTLPSTRSTPDVTSSFTVSRLSGRASALAEHRSRIMSKSFVFNTRLGGVAGSSGSDSQDTVSFEVSEDGSAAVVAGPDGKPLPLLYITPDLNVRSYRTEEILFDFVVPALGSDPEAGEATGNVGGNTPPPSRVAFVATDTPAVIMDRIAAAAAQHISMNGSVQGSFVGSADGHSTCGSLSDDSHATDSDDDLESEEEATLFDPDAVNLADEEVASVMTDQQPQIGSADTNGDAVVDAVSDAIVEVGMAHLARRVNSHTALTSPPESRASDVNLTHSSPQTPLAHMAMSIHPIGLDLQVDVLAGPVHGSDAGYLTPEARRETIMDPGSATSGNEVHRRSFSNGSTGSMPRSGGGTAGAITPSNPLRYGSPAHSRKSSQKSLHSHRMVAKPSRKANGLNQRGLRVNVDGVVIGPPGGGARVVTSSPLATVRTTSFGTSGEVDVSPVRSPRSPRSGGIAAVSAHTLRVDKESPTKPRRPAAPSVWKKGIQIGEGSFGRVFRGMNSLTGEFFAVKELPLVPGMHDQDLLITELMREIDVLSSLEHQHIVSYIGTQRSDENLFLFTEYITGGSLHSILSEFGALDEEVIAVYTRQILEGLTYLHKRHIIHRDIKGANILITNTGVVKLSDFGCSKTLNGLSTPTGAAMDASFRRIKGTIPFMAPEVIRQTGHGRKSDIWSVGCVVIEMATGCMPWAQFSNKLSAMFHIATSGEHPPIPEGLSEECHGFLMRCFAQRPEDRSTAEDLLKDPWLNSTRSNPGSAQELAVHMRDIASPASRFTSPAPHPIREDEEETEFQSTLGAVAPYSGRHGPTSGVPRRPVGVSGGSPAQMPSIRAGVRSSLM